MRVPYTIVALWVKEPSEWVSPVSSAGLDEIAGPFPPRAARVGGAAENVDESGAPEIDDWWCTWGWGRRP